VTLTETLIVLLMILAVAAVIMPRITDSQIPAHENAALTSVRDINAAEQAYAATHPDLGFATSLGQLIGAPQVSVPAVDQSLATGHKDGYAFNYIPGERVNGAIRTYTITAIPEEVGTTGVRRFYSDQSGEIHYNAAGTADANSAVIQ
jgi:type II secretory pathway pseudopilin PulG